jgi:hypothetical protein
MIRLEDPTTLSLLFHLNSEPWLNDEAYKGGTPNQEFKRPEGILSEITWRAQPVEFAATSTTRAPDQSRTCRKPDFAGPTNYFRLAITLKFGFLHWLDECFGDLALFDLLFAVNVLVLTSAFQRAP